MSRRHLVVSYDVTDDRRRARLAKFLRGYVTRVQKSVFEGLTHERRFEPLREGIGRLIDRKEDSVRIYTLCVRCQGATEVVGTGAMVESEDEDVLV